MAEHIISGSVINPASPLSVELAATLSEAQNL